ncbi:BglG family transcription antiterminator [Pelosinus fermentans]|uniref:Transcriptional antiterminator, BglG n=1 Tax=Pelosinus fermentans JBW45 TaxID=1192197 RepID=I9NVC3_9FIRM|nr:BglG family transcription antiterminator [Pelosinus fermentans]AJQ28429.1 transcriptional antiterminator, BglG [Pelosinus fermentans JBW45]
MIVINHKETIKKKMLVELLNRTVPITITNLANLFNKTGRTMRNYLDEIQDEYKEFRIEIVRKTNVGVYITMDDKDKEELLNLFEKDKVGSFNADNFSSKYRQIYILKTLFEDKFSYTIQMFADDLYCSKSTIVNELVHVQAWVERYNLILQRKQNQGLWIEGDEKDYRRAFKDLIDDIQDKEHEVDDFIVSDVGLDYRIDIVDYEKIKSMFPKINLYTIQRIIQEAEKELGLYFTDQAFLNLITHMAITIERLKNHKSVSSTENYFESLKKEREYTVARWVVNELSKEFKVSFPEEEIGYISIHMMGAKIQEHYDAEESSAIIENYDVDFTDMAKSIISMSSEILDVDLTKDEGLLTRLVLHLRPTVMRLKYGLRLTNPILSRIKEEYTNIFGVAWACNSIFENKFGVTINEDEVGYLVLHLALSVDKIRSKIKTVIVCSSGIGTSQLVASKLVKKFDNLDITHILPYNLLSQKIIEEADLIITTIRNIKKDEKVIYISALVSENDYMNITNTIKSLKRDGLGIPLSNSEDVKELDDDEYQESILGKELCFLDSDITDFPQAIIYYGKLMEKKGYAKIGFHEDILKREKIGSTYIGKGIAIPHAKDIFVNKSKICIVKFIKPITWQGNKVDVIFILCLKFNDANNTKNFFKKFYSLLENDEMISKIKNAQSINDITYLFD